MREMTLTDLEAVAAIEQAVQAHPWKLSQFADSIAAGHVCLVDEADGGIRGYAVLMPALETADVLTIAVAPGHQRQGLGRSLLSAMRDWGRSHGVQRIFLEVRESNAPAIALYRSSGFRQIARRGGYYRTAEGTEDAFVMCHELTALEYACE
jgi:ribosomal-protein-alanine acetyltransferase